MKQIIYDILDSFEKRIQFVSETFKNSQDLIEDNKQQRESTSVKLRDNLAQAESLRKKDFDNMMANIKNHHHKREIEVREVLRKYIYENQRLSTELRSLLSNKEANGQHHTFKEIRASFEKIKKELEDREREVRKILTIYQVEQDNYFEVMKTLLSKGKEVRLPEVRQVVRDISFNNGI